jgi:hypothetical protein
MGRLAERLEQAAPLLGPQALANCCMALAKLQALPVLQQEQQQQQQQQQQLQLPPGLLPALEARTRALLGKLGPGHTAMVLWGLARLKARPSAATLEVSPAATDCW